MEKHLRQTIDYPYTLMYEEVYKAARNKPDVSAYEFQGKKTRYEDFVKKIETVAGGFSSIGIGKGDSCLLYTSRCV